MKLFNRLARSIAVLLLTAPSAWAQAPATVQPDQQNILPRDSTPRVFEDRQAWQYQPFYEDNRLTALRGKPTLTIANDYPRLDGATAFCPVFAAAVQGVYRHLDRNTVRQYYACNRTPYAYQRLINGEVDLIFAVQPSAEQIAAAKAKGLALQLTPVAKEAFVFLVNTQNPVSNLSVQQIREIYSGRIDNWRAVGGENAGILAFQRPPGSGSQSTMLAKVMQGTPMKDPLREQALVETMAKAVERVGTRVADYRNYQPAIGYSFRYYATEMVRNNNVRLLSIDGVAPTAANIRSGRYPFTVDVYMVTVRTPSPQTKQLMNWFLSKQGQRLVEDVGYVRLK